MNTRSTSLFPAIVLTLLVSGFQSTVSHAEDWPHWRGPSRDGHVLNKEPFTESTEFHTRWSAEIGTGFSSIVAVGDRVYSMGNSDDQDTVWCLDAKTGDVIWSHSYPCPLDPNLFEGGPTSTPTFSNGKLFTLSRRGDTFCFDAKSGAVDWNVNIAEAHDVNIPTWGFAGSPLVLEDRVILNAGAHGLALKPKDGTLLWKSDNSDDAGYSTPLPVEIDGTTFALMLAGKALNAVDIGSGERAWSVRWITRYGINAADPILLNNHQLLVSSGYSKGTSLIDFTATEAKPAWRSRDLRNQMSPGVLIDGRLYAVDGDAGSEPKLTCIDPLTGKPIWSDVSFGSATILAVGKQLFILSETGEFTIAKPEAEGISVIKHHQLIDGKYWTPICYVNSTIFARNAIGKLSAVEIRRK